ncbi:hypothetical protein K438DRAFT_1999374 [Mycena galopus ATCC 62051]|nr:hypothetical protein K438DRAFT_1999374 [Mycena galopus ATCC 62051]
MASLRTYYRWYFATQLDLDDTVGHTPNPGLNHLRSQNGKLPSHQAPREKALTTALER